MMLIGLFCVLYFFIVAVNTGLKSKFPVFWLITGTMIIVSEPTGILLNEMQLPGMLRDGIRLILFLVLLCFLMAEMLILSAMCKKYDKIPDVIIVLGAQLNKNGPGKTLKSRLDLANDVARLNPESILVVSGGMGENEPMTEAEGMRAYLAAKGIAQDRIVIEKCSRDTYENLMFSKQILSDYGYRVEMLQIGILTTNFHIFRALRLAKKAGYGSCIPMPAKCTKVLLPNYLVREGFALIKDLLSGRL